jgi:trans-aconitate methyltransferase
MSTSQQTLQKSTFATGYSKSSLDRYAYRTVETCCVYLLPHLQSLPTDFTFLDIGCGPGSITTDLASRFPRAKFTGIDPGKPFLEKAEALARERNVAENTTFKFGDLDSLSDVLGEQMGTFDVVHCHQVLNHLSDPVAGLKILKAAAKSNGGIVAVREATSVHGDIFYPLLPKLKRWQELQKAIQSSATGRDPGMGAELLEISLKAGFPRAKIQASASTWCYSEPAEKAMWAESIVSMLENKDSFWYKKAVALGTAEEELVQIVEAWKEWERRDESWSVFVSAEVVCRNG